MRIVIFGANGGTGRLLTKQALDAGHDVVAVTRNPGSFPVTGAGLEIVATDVLDRPTTAQAIQGADAVLSTLGVPFTRRPITLYSAGIASITEAMTRHGVKRLVAVSSSATEPSRHADGGFLLNRVVQPLVTRTIGKTTYADMRLMEAHLRASSLEWTVLRPGGLFDAERTTDYELAEDRSDRVFTSRADLAAALLALGTSREWIGSAVAVNTLDGVPTVLQMLRREAFASR
jgi:putative NADH-flavin reductase